MRSATEIASVVACTSILQVFMFANNAPSDRRIHTIVTWVRLFCDILGHVGTSPHLQSFRTLWTTGTHALCMLEEAVFPGDPIETSQHLVEPRHPRALSALTEATSSEAKLDRGCCRNFI